MQTKFLNQNWRGFTKLCLKMKTEKQFNELFNLLLTNAEQADIAARLAIVEALLLGKKPKENSRNN